MASSKPPTSPSAEAPTHPFSFFGADWLNADTVATALTARRIPGVTFTAATEPIADDANHYPFHGQTISVVRLTLTDPTALDTPELGIEILAVLHKLYPKDFQLDKVQRLLGSRATLAALERGDDPRTHRIHLATRPSKPSLTPQSPTSSTRLYRTPLSLQPH